MFFSLDYFHTAVCLMVKLTFSDLVIFFIVSLNFIFVPLSSVLLIFIVTETAIILLTVFN